jgi:hypothetical protein
MAVSIFHGRCFDVMRAFSTVALLEPFSEIASHSDITFLGISFANQYVNVIESEADVRRHIAMMSLDWLACQAVASQRRTLGSHPLARLHGITAWQPRKLSGLEARGFEPLTSSLQSWRSTN